MVIVSQVFYPPESATQMAKRFLEAPQVPEFMNRKGPYVNSSLAGGVFILTLYELDNASLADGMNFMGNYMTTYFGIPGFKYEIKPFFTIEEGLKMLGM